jgi:hypothetical protein
MAASRLSEEAAYLSRRQSRIEARQRDLSLAPPDPEDMVEIQSRFDDTYRALDLRAPAPQYRESTFTYRRRLLGDLQPYTKSDEARTADLFKLSGTPLDEFERQIIDEAKATAADPRRGDWRDPAQLREVVHADGSGREIHEFHGDPLSWMLPFMGDAKAVVRLGHLPPVKRWIG